MSALPLKIIQLSDIHLLSNESGELLGVNTQESFQSVLSLLHKYNDDIDLILLTGDLSQDGSRAAYKRIATLLKKLQVPIYYIPGNHDNSKVMLEIYPCETISNQRHIVLEHWHLILLDSQKSGGPEGYLSIRELTYLQNCLDANPKHHGMVVFHHHPIPVGSRWLDNIGLSNADEFWEIILRYPKVNTILFGHVHQEFKQTVNGVKCLGSPSTCIQFKRKQDQFGLEKLPPGFRSIHLYEDGCVETEVIRGSQYIGVFDNNANGY